METRSRTVSLRLRRVTITPPDEFKVDIMIYIFSFGYFCGYSTYLQKQTKIQCNNALEKKVIFHALAKLF